MPYHSVAIDLTEAQAKKALKGGAIRIKKEQIGKGHLVLHPVNKKKVEKAIIKGTAVILELSPAELAETALHHIEKHGIEGSGFWSKIWGGLKKTWKFLKDSGIASRIADIAIPAVATAVGAPSMAVPARALVKASTGAGIKKGRMTTVERQEKLKAAGLYLS
jgi:hypothetical protein